MCQECKLYNLVAAAVVVVAAAAAAAAAIVVAVVSSMNQGKGHEIVDNIKFKKAISFYIIKMCTFCPLLSGQRHCMTNLNITLCGFNIRDLCYKAFTVVINYVL